MVKEFLLSYQESLFNQKIDYEEDLDLVRTKIKENEKFIAMLSSENDSLFTDFSPREVESKHKERIRELNEVLQGLYDERLKLTNSLDNIEKKLKEIEPVIQEAGRLESGENILSVATSSNVTNNNEGRDLDELKETEQFEDSVSISKSSNPDSVDVDLDRISKTLDQVISFLPVDPMRAKLELQQLKKKL